MLYISCYALVSSGIKIATKYNINNAFNSKGHRVFFKKKTWECSLVLKKKEDRQSEKEDGSRERSEKEYYYEREADIMYQKGA